MLLTVAILAPTNGPRNWQKQTAAHATKSLSDPARTGCQKISAQHITYENSYHSKSIQQGTGVSSTAGKTNPHRKGVQNEYFLLFSSVDLEFWRPFRGSEVKFIYSYTLCVPCIVLQCVNDQRDAQFL